MISNSSGNCKKQMGFTLVEALVAFVVLSFSLVGLMGLQGFGLQMTTSSLNRVKATYLAQDMVERMRANMPSVGVGAYDMTAGTPTALTNCMTVTGCTPQEMASTDLATWANDVAAQLPAGEGFVCIDSTQDDGTGSASPGCDAAGSVYVVKVWWQDERTGNKTRFAYSFRP